MIRARPRTHRHGRQTLELRRRGAVTGLDGHALDDAGAAKVAVSIMSPTYLPLIAIFLPPATFSA